MALPNYEAVRFDSAEHGDGELVQRYDVGELSAPERTFEGFLRVQGILTKPGVFPYRRPDGTSFNELRHPDEVFAPESMKSFALVPVTNEHQGILTPGTIRQHQVGQIGKPERVGDVVRADMMLTNERAIEDAENGKTGLSCGYRSRVFNVPGTWTDPQGVEHRFDSFQTSIRGNHVALTQLSRVGSEARIRMDAKDAIVDGHPAKGARAVKIKIGNQEVEVDEAVGNHIQSLQGRADAAEAAAKKPAADNTEVVALKREIDTMRGQLDAATADLKSRQDSSEKKTKKEKEDAALLTRLDTIARAAPILEKPFADLVKMDEADIMREVVKKEAPDHNIEGKNEHYVQGIFMHVTSRVDTAAEINKLVGDGKEAAKKKTEEERQDSDLDKKVSDARAKMIEEMKSAWKPPQQN